MKKFLISMIVFFIVSCSMGLCETYNSSTIKKGDIIVFGHYEQDNNLKNGPEPIEWIVLAKDTNKILLISKYVLDYLPYDSMPSGLGWKYSTIRKWLNNDFFLQCLFQRRSQSSR